MVGIIDDREDVWNYAPNLVHVKPYRFFQGTADINAPPGLTKSEHDGEPIDHKVVDHSTPDSAAGQKGEEYSKTAEISQEISDGQKSDSGSGEGAEGGTGKGQVNESGALGGDKCGEKTDESLENSVGTQISKEDSSGVPSVTAQTDESDTTRAVCADVEGGASSDGGAEETGREVGSMEVVSECVDSQWDSREEVENAELSKKAVESVKNVSVDEKKNVEEVEWEDEDDYLLHLQEVLHRVHKAYYEMYEQSQQNSSAELPDLKNIIPYVRKKVLKGANIVFSGMFPLNMAAEKSKAYVVAKALGANIHSDIMLNKTKGGSDPNATTHLVAAKAGTGKHKMALKVKGIHVVSGDWLWTCNERWEWVSETLFPLGSKDESPESGTLRLSKGRSKKRKSEKDSWDGGDVADDEAAVANDKIASLSSAVVGKRLKTDPSKQVDGKSDGQKPSSSNSVGSEESEAFANSYNPLYSFSDEDIEFMDKEVDEMLDEEGDSSESDTEREDRVRKEVLGKEKDSDSDSDSLAGDFPRGWKLRRKSFSPQHKDDAEEVEKKTDGEDDDETENELERYEKNMAAFAPPDSDSDSKDNDSIGSVDDEIADAVEKEFLSSL